jgi:hypothetical protein
MYAAGIDAACVQYGLKEARHAADRLYERTNLDPEVIPHLDAQADLLSDHVGPGHYYLPLKDASGAHVGYAAFKTVPGYPNQRLVLATILGANMKPKGVNLSDRMTQTTFTQKVAEELRTNTKLHQKFEELGHLLRKRGVYAGTPWKRIAIPKTKLTESEIKTLGFVPVSIAIPEPGQDRFESFRHPNNRYHIHSHGDHWSMHEDRHHSSTMLKTKAKGFLDTQAARIKGLPHLVTEGLPGIYYYLKKKIELGEKSLAAHVKEKMHPKARYSIDQLPTTKRAYVTTELQPHQQRVVDRMADPDQRGLIVHHGLGSGKTLTSIAVADRLGMPADVVTPAALQENYSKEVAKHTDVPPEILQQTLENVARKGGKTLTKPLMIVDEAHRTRNPGKTQAALMKSPAEKRLLLTGSLLYNQPSDIAGPINLVAGETTLPSNPADFDKHFVEQTQRNPGIIGN